MSLLVLTHLRRHIDHRRSRLLRVHPAFLIEDIGGVGKTSTATRLSASVLRLDHPPTAAINAVPLGVPV